jgi:hypothetical protein
MLDQLLGRMSAQARLVHSSLQNAVKFDLKVTKGLQIAGLF